MMASHLVKLTGTSLLTLLGRHNSPDRPLSDAAGGELLLCSFYIETNALTVGTQSPAPDRGNFKLGYAGLQQCLDACDDRTW
jgi:hypothetical protein